MYTAMLSWSGAIRKYMYSYLRIFVNPGTGLELHRTTMIANKAGNYENMEALEKFYCLHVKQMI